MNPLQDNDEPGNSNRTVVLRYLFMILGLAVLGFGLSLTVQARLGLASWSVLHKAIENLTLLTFGQAAQTVGVLVIIVGWVLGTGPRIGTFLNILFVGWFVDLFRIHVLSTPEVLFFQFVWLIAGVCMTGFGVGMYLSADVGAGPRDTLMLALAARMPWPIGRVRSTIELTAMVLGWLLGGPIGVGTVVVSVLIGPVVQYSLRTFQQLEAHPLLGTIIHVPIGQKVTPARGPARTGAASD